MTSRVAAPNVSLGPAGRIAHDIPCIHCGYNLRTLLADQACPECNQPVGESLRGDMLWFSNPAWLAKLAGGTAWLILGSALWLVFRFALELLLQQRLATGTMAPATVVFTGNAIFYAIKMAEFVGIWMVTRPDPRTLGNPSPLDARALARILLVATFLLSFVPWRAAPGSITSTILWLIPGMISLFGWICLYVHLARLARRIPSAGLVWLTYTAVAVMALDQCLGYANSLWFALRTPAIRAGTSIMWIPFLLWCLSLASMVLLLAAQVLYRMRFRQALRQSKQAMQKANPLPGASG